MENAENDRQPIRLGVAPSPALGELVEVVSACIQCGTCSGSCPTATEMDYTPRQIMHLISHGMAQETIGSQAIWLCATCFSCTVRCPRGIPVADVMARLRGIAVEQGVAETAGMTFNKAFLHIVERYGRMFEPELLLRYHARRERLGLLRTAPIGLTLLRKGKIAPLPERLRPAEGGDEVRQIFARVAARRKPAGE